ncbi:MAG: hypothetical protein R6W06_05165, partial [Prochlorococcaceae cyanobacterium]
PGPLSPAGPRLWSGGLRRGGGAGGSGFLAVYVAGIVLGSRSIVFRRGILSFHDATAWLGQFVLFVMLGLLSGLVAVAGGPLAAARPFRWRSMPCARSMVRSSTTPSKPEPTLPS